MSCSKCVDIVKIAQYFVHVGDVCLSLPGCLSCITACILEVTASGDGYSFLNLGKTW